MGTFPKCWRFFSGRLLRYIVTGSWRRWRCIRQTTSAVRAAVVRRTRLAPRLLSSDCLPAWSDLPTISRTDTNVLFLRLTAFISILQSSCDYCSIAVQSFEKYAIDRHPRQLCVTQAHSNKFYCPNFPRKQTTKRFVYYFLSIQNYDKLLRACHTYQSIWYVHVCVQRIQSSRRHFDS